MPHYPSGYFGVSTGSIYNNVVTRRLAVKDRVAFAQSPRFGGQWMEPKGVPAPYNGTIIDAQGATTELLSELNLIAPLFPDLGIPVILSQVGVATNLLTSTVGVGVSWVGGVTTTTQTYTSFDGVGIATGLRVLYYGLTTGSLNGVYLVGFGQTLTGVGPNYYSLTRAPELSQWWQFAKPKVWTVAAGTNNAGKIFKLATDAWETGNTFNIASGANLQSLAGTSITFTITDFSPGLNTSLIYPAYSSTATLNTGEYDFLSQNSLPKFMYLKNRCLRLSYQIFKMREQYTPSVSQYQNNVPYPIGAGNTLNNIGLTTLNNLPAGSRYPSSFNRGF